MERRAMKMRKFLRAGKNKKGAILVLVGLSLFAFVSMLSLVADFGHIFVTKAELQNTADSAALAAVLDMRFGEDEARATAVSFGEAHRVAGNPILVDPNDVVFGRYDQVTETFEALVEPFNAVRVEAKRTDGSPSGPLGLFFARLFNHDTSNVRAISTGVLDPRVTGVRGKNRLIPYSVIDFVVDQNGDGLFDIGETIDIHPRSDAPGNFGFLDLDMGSNDVPELRNYIENGYDGDFIIPVGGSLPVSGSPGIVGNSLLNSFQTILDEEVFLPVHNFVTGEGNGSIFNVVAILAVRIHQVRLNGNQEKRFIHTEIISLASSVLVVDSTAEENNSVAKPRLVL